MGRFRTPNQKKAYNALNSRLNAYVGQVQSIYDMATKRMSELATSTGYDGSSEFFFRNYPEIAEAVKDVQAQFVSELGHVIMGGTSEEWRQSNLIQNLLADKVLKHYRAQVHGKRFKHYYQTNSDALQAFQQRRDRGLNLSDKLWWQAGEYTKEIEAGISTTISNAIEKGMSAITLSKRLSKYLDDYPSLKRDYWETYGKAANIHDCEYRSIRLARSEINMAYRTAEQTRWKQFDFIVGYEIKLSGSHPAEDICDSLAGRYPKDFVWTGWHPNDMCYAIPIIMSEEEYWNGDRKNSKEVITDVPQNYKDWVIENNARIKAADEHGTLPYFLKDNPDFRQYIGKDYVTEWRHRTRNEDEIRLAWKNRHDMMEVSDNLRLASLRMHARYTGFDMSEFEEMLRTTDLKYDKYGESSIFDKAIGKVESEYLAHRAAINASFKKLSGLYDSARFCAGQYRMKGVIKDIEDAMGDYSPYKKAYGTVYTQQRFDKAYTAANKKLKANARKIDEANQLEVENALGIKKGHPMTFERADEGRGNIRYKAGIDNPYSRNCQICVVADEMRRRGYDVTALGRLEGQGIADAIAYDITYPWIVKGSGLRPKVRHISMVGKNDAEVLKSIEDSMKAKGRYHIGFTWRHRDFGHRVCIERRANGSLRFYDPQDGSEYNILEWIGRMDKSLPIRFLKVDDLLVDPRIIRSIVKRL